MTKILTGGVGRQGYCKLCSLADPNLQHQLDQRVAKRWSVARINEWMAKYDLGSVSRMTLYKHREHVANPKDRLVTAVERRRATQPQLPAQVSEEQFLDAVVATGYQKVIDNPESVTIDHALKASSIRANLQKKGQSINVLVGVFGGGTRAIAPPVIEAEVREE